MSYSLLFGLGQEWSTRHKGYFFSLTLKKTKTGGNYFARLTSRLRSRTLEVAKYIQTAVAKLLAVLFREILATTQILHCAAAGHCYNKHLHIIEAQ